MRILSRREIIRKTTAASSGAGGLHSFLYSTFIEIIPALCWTPPPLALSRAPGPTEADGDVVARTALGAPPSSRLSGFLAILPAKLSRPHLSKAWGR